MEIRYSYIGLKPVDINYIKCNSSELKQALKVLQDNIPQVTRINLNVDGKNIYIYHSTLTGNKRVSKKLITEWEQAMEYIASEKGKKTQKYQTLQKKIEKLLFCKTRKKTH